jgi:hypothetical protein
MALEILENKVQVSFSLTDIGYQVVLVDVDYIQEVVTIPSKQFINLFKNTNTDCSYYELPFNEAQSIGFKLLYSWENERLGR